MSTQRKIILVDQDNVIADQRRGFYTILEREYPDIPRPDIETIYDFDIHKCFPEEYHERIKSIRLREGFFRNLPIIEGAREGLERLAAEGFEVRIVTAPTWQWDPCIREKFAWIEEHLGRDWCTRTMIARDKTLVAGDILIDDKPNVSGIMTPSWTHVLYDQPYNRNVKDKQRMTWKSSDLDSFISSLATP